MRVFLGVCGAAALTLAVGAVGLPAAQETSPPSVRDGVYTPEQADRGEVLYDDRCAVCHGAIRQFVPEMAALLGDHNFRNAWRGRSLGEMFGYIRETMPQDAPGTLTAAQTAEIVAHILRGNRLPAGDMTLPEDEETLNGIPFDP
ncbi:MAG: c-type cytochrome [Gammaproteobacteria bacterium]|nr:c-type cytochrome [Gammaproteobacteria bacterium]